MTTHLDPMNPHDQDHPGATDGPAASTPEVNAREHPTHDTNPAAVSIPGVGEVIPLPRREPPQPGTELVRSEAIDAELVPLEQPAAQRVVRAWRVSRSAMVVSGRRVRTVATHDRTKVTAKVVSRNLLYIPAGAGVLIKRVWEAKTNSRYERLLRGAEAAGDREALAEWEQRAETAKQRRHDRTMDWLAATWKLPMFLFAGVMSVFAALLTLGVLLALASEDFGRVLDPIMGMLTAIEWTVWAVTMVWGPLVLVGPWLFVLYLWNLGRTRGSLPHWIQPADAGDDRGVVPDEGAILSALKNLNMAAFNQRVKDGWLPRWVLATGRDGKGWRTQLELPQGVNVAMINERKALLAHNLVRLPVEVWPTEPKNQPGVLDLWVADQGLLTGPVAPYPLLTEGTCDYFAGVPVGIDQRGDEVIGRLMACNYAIAGIMGSGKTSLVINLLLGAMLDPLVDIDVYVMAENVDYDPMKPRLRTLVKGDDEVTVPAAIEALRELRSMVSERGRILGELGGEETKLTRQIAESNERMRPRVVVVDECQELFMAGKLGEEAKDLAIKLMMKARKVGITLIWVTPAPSADSLPRALAKTVSHRVCFAIGDHQGNDAILGTGAHKRGITAVDLVAGEDVGTAMASGFAARAGLLRTHHIRKEKGIDEITPIVNRAMALRDNAGITTNHATPAAPVEVDPLADIAAVLSASGQARLRTQEVISLLGARNRTVYGSWTFADLNTALPESAKPYKTGGQIKVSAARVAEALADRDSDTDSDELDGADE